MDLRQLRYFIRVAELGSFSRAAPMLDIGQPSLSRQVRLLEVELRQNLLIRNGRGVEPTEAGKVLLELGRGVLHQMDRVYEALSSAEGKLAGRASVGLPPTWAKLVVPTLAKLLKRELPHATLALSEGLSFGLREAVLQGNLDIALLYDAVPSPDLELTPLKNEELVLIGPRGNGGLAGAPVSLAQLAALPLVVPGRPNAIRMLLERELCAAGHRPRIAYEVDGVPSILDLVRTGEGHAVLPLSAIERDDPQAFHCRPVGPGSLVTSLMMAVSARRSATHTQKAAFRLLVELVKAAGARLPCLQGIAASEVTS